MHDDLIFDLTADHHRSEDAVKRFCKVQIQHCNIVSKGSPGTQEGSAHVDPESHRDLWSSAQLLHLQELGKQCLLLLTKTSMKALAYVARD
jgi:hypothetical protein